MEVRVVSLMDLYEGGVEGEKACLRLSAVFSAV